MDLRIGQVYEVPCAEIMLAEDGRIYYIPVHDHYHADAQFGFPQKHYHIDGRFEMEPRMKHFFGLVDGHTSHVITTTADRFKLLGIVTLKRACTSLATGLVLPADGPKKDLYRDWYQGFVGQKCEGRKCPHFGMPMIELNGQLVCPMHNLKADLHTLCVIPQEE